MGQPLSAVPGVGTRGGGRVAAFREESEKDPPADISVKTLAWVRMLGKPAEEIEAVDLDGKPAQLADYRGRVVVMSFWFSKEHNKHLEAAILPHLSRLLDRFKGQPVTVLAIHDASITSLVGFRHAVEEAQSQIGGGNNIRWLLDRVPLGKGRSPLSRAGELGSGRTADTYERESAFLYVVDKTGKLVLALTEEILDVEAFTIDRNGKLVREKLDVPVREAGYDFKNVMNVLEGKLEGLLGLPRSSSPIDKIQQRPTGPIVIRGRVVDPEGKPIAGARVKHFLADDTIVKTGPGGDFHFTLQKVTDSLELITVESTEMATQSFNCSFDAGFVSADAPTVLLVQPSGEISQPLRLGPGASVAGRLLRNGKPLTGVTVVLRYADHLGLSNLECKTVKQGTFRFPHVLPLSDCWASVKLGDLKAGDAVLPRQVKTPEEGSVVDLGVLEVQKGRKLAGRLVCSDGKALPDGMFVALSIPVGDGSLLAIPDRKQRFELSGIPDGPVKLLVSHSSDETVGYHLSPKNVCLDPKWPLRLEGRVDHDIADLTILLDPGEVRRLEIAGMLDIDPAALADFNDAKAGPITGVAPGDYPAK